MLRAVKLLIASCLALGLVACGVSSGSPTTPPEARAPDTPPVTTSLAGSCPDVVRGELTDVARRIYAQAVDGRSVASAVKRLHRTAALATAVSSGSATAVRRAFLPIRHQIVRVEVFDRTHLLYRFGRAPSFAPIRGDLYDRAGAVVGHFVLAVTDQQAYAGLLKRLTGGDAVFRTGRRPATRTGFTTVSLATQAYPSGPLAIDVQLPAPPASLCGIDAADTRLNTIAYVGRRLLHAENHSRAVDETLHHVEQDPAFRRATAADDRHAIREAIIFDVFRDHAIHVVRVRVTRGPRLIYDLGGPYALQPATGVVRSPDGRSAATFSLAVQDDTGYIKLLHRFTGADVQLVSPLGKVPGSTLEPGPAAIPVHGAVTYAGRRYLAESFDGTAFPAGRLRVSVLVPA